MSWMGEKYMKRDIQALSENTRLQKLQNEADIVIQKVKGRQRWKMKENVITWEVKSYKK